MTALSHQLDPCMVAGRGGETSVARQQRRVERFGEGDVDGVIRRKIVPQIPDARQKKLVRISMQRKVRKVGESRAAPFAIDLALRRIPADHLRDFDVEQMRCVQRPPRVEEPPVHRYCGRRAKQHLDEGRGVDDDHWRSRSAPHP